MRIKVLHLPADEFALIFDGVDSSVESAEVDTLKSFAGDTGAKASLVSTEPVEVD